MIKRAVILLFSLGIISCKDEPPAILDTSTNEKDKVIILDSNPVINEEVKTIASEYLVVPDFDKNMLSRLIIELVNSERISYSYQPLKNNLILLQAAHTQNTYISTIGQLTHIGNTSGTHDLRSRVQAHGSNFKLLAENIAMKSFLTQQKEGIKYIEGYSYKEVAFEFFEMWKNSPGHYKNMMLEDIRHIGVAVKWNNTQNAIYATQVFGG